MDQTGINGSNQFFAPVPAGYSTRDISGPGGTLELTTSESASDIIELTGTLTGPITVVVATPNQIPQVVGTSRPLGSAYQLVPSWAKIIRNETIGGFPVTVTGPGGIGPFVPSGRAEWFYSPDGINVKDVCCANNG